MLNERDSMVDLLIQEKDIIKVYGALLTETTNTDLRKLLEKNFVEASKDQYKVFDSMVKRKYYMPKAAETSAIEEQKKMMSNIKSTLKS